MERERDDGPSSMPTKPPRIRILLIDDDRDSLLAMSEWLERRGYEPIAVASAAEAFQYLNDGVAVIVTDLCMPNIDGLDVIRRAKKDAPHAIVIVVSADRSVDKAVAAIREGAFDYVTKPINLSELTHRIERAVENRALSREIAALQLRLGEKYTVANMVGTSSAMRALYEKIQLVSNTRSTVLITGESGTGKELVARSIHDLSQRRNEPFVPVNCAAISETLVESELFGHEKGAFTGATHRKQGFFEAARLGTLFIDEIGELKLGLQSKFLRAIESRKILRVGGTKEEDIDIRLVAATNRDLKMEVEQGNFREDLYYRLKIVELKLPPLRERREDIPMLIRHFIDEISSISNRSVRDLTPEALSLLKGYSWPGNVRELRNTLEGIIVLSLKEEIEADDLPSHITGHAESQAIIKPGMTMAQIEEEAIRRTLEHTKGNRTRTAEILGISVRTLQRKIKDFQLD